MSDAYEGRWLVAGMLAGLRSREYDATQEERDAAMTFAVDDEVKHFQDGRVGIVLEVTPVNLKVMLDQVIESGGVKPPLEMFRPHTEWNRTGVHRGVATTPAPEPDAEGHGEP